MAIRTLTTYPMPQPDSFPANKVDWTIDPKRAVLLIHDMQEYFLHFYQGSSPLVADLVAAIVKVKATCKARGIRTIYTAQPVDQTLEDRGLLNDMWGRGLDNRPELQAIVPQLAPAGDDIVLTKWRYSAFQKCDLEARLQAMGKDQMLICGVYAHIGCLMTAAHAFMLNIKPFLIGDAVADFSLEDHHMALKYVASRCGSVITTNDVIKL